MTFRATILIAFFSFTFASVANAARVEIHNGQFYVDGQPFYIRAVGYAPWRPHQHPGVSYADTNRRWTQMDFERIKAAHFNTLRTWDALAPEELDLARQYGLWVIQTIGLDTHQDFSDPHNQDNAVAQAQSVAQQTKDYDNVLGYIVMNQPRPDAVLSSGQDETLRFFRRLKRAVQLIDPRPVSMASWAPLIFLNQNDFDFVTFDAYSFWPASINSSLGYAGYIRWIADNVAQDRPFFVGQTGGYSVSAGSQSESGGFGGLTEYNQSVRDIQSLRQAVQGHADGTALVSWIDTWFYPTDADTHDDTPWEWDGLLGIPTDSPKDMEGIPRRVLADVTVYNEAVVLEPKADHIYSREKPIAIDVAVADNVREVRYNINGDDWHPLTDSGHHRWRGFFQLPKQARKRQRIAIQALDKSSTALAGPEISFLTAVLPEQLTVTPHNPSASKAGALDFQVNVIDGTRHPIAHRKVDYGFFYPVSLREMKASAMTDADGHVAVHCSLIPQSQDRYLVVSAGTNSPENIRTGDLHVFPLGQ